MCVQVSPGKAYVAGYDVELVQLQQLMLKNQGMQCRWYYIPFEMGHLWGFINVAGAPENKTALKSQFKADTGGQKVIGQARVYAFNLTDAAYSNAESQWDLYLYDIQTILN